MLFRSGSAGRPIDKVWVEEGSTPARELYLALLVDRARGWPAFIASTEGGMDIEKVAHDTPEKIITFTVDPVLGLQNYQCRQMGFQLELDAKQRDQLQTILHGLYKLFNERDLSLVEINPLALLAEGTVVALDSKVTIDDNALFRHPELAEMRDLGASDPLEALAREKGVTYVKLDGDVGVLGNGAGLTMSTVDVVTFVGGRPANFCDLGGGGDAQGVVDALEVITRDPQVRAIFFNVFGGITRCDEVARGILQAVEQMGIDSPIVVRLDGTNAEDGRRILGESGMANLHAEATMLDGARRAVELAA